jgi:hypothetical protein
MTKGVIRYHALWLMKRGWLGLDLESLVYKDTYTHIAGVGFLLIHHIIQSYFFQVHNGGFLIVDFLNLG